MKYIRIYENYNDETEIKKLLTHLISIIKSYGFREENWLDNRCWETQFYIDNTYIFRIALKLNIFSSSIRLDVIEGDAPALPLVEFESTSDFFNFFIKLLKTINGVTLIEVEEYFSDLKRYEYKIDNKNVDTVIKLLTKENFKIAKNSNKYNI